MLRVEGGGGTLRVDDAEDVDDVEVAGGAPEGGGMVGRKARRAIPKSYLLSSFKTSVHTAEAHEPVRHHFQAAILARVLARVLAASTHRGRYDVMTTWGSGRWRVRDSGASGVRCRPMQASPPERSERSPEDLERLESRDVADGGDERLDAHAQPRDGLALALRLYRELVRVRLVSARMVALQRAGRIASHASSILEEAPAVAAALAARDSDWIFPGRREWGAALVRGAALDAYVHHAFGTAADPARGHSAPDHLPARHVRVVPPSGVVGAHLPQAVGAAWAAKIRKEDVVTLALFGEGAVDGGDFHNALNFAGVFKAPVVFIARRSVADRAVAYGLASTRVDGTDAVAITAAVREAIAHARAGKGAVVVEAETPAAIASRSLADDELAVPRVLDLGVDDPIVKLRVALGSSAAGETSTDAPIVRDTVAAIDAAVRAAEGASPPPRATIFEHVYASVPSHLVLQREG